MLNAKCGPSTLAASWARGSLPLELVFSGSDCACGCALFAVRFSLRDAHVPVPLSNSGRRGCPVRTLFFRNVSLGAWVAGLALFAFAWIGRCIATGEASAPSIH